MKKIFAVIFLLAALFLTLSLVITLLNIAPDQGESVPFYIGYYGSQLLLAFIAFLLARTGIRWLKAPAEKSSETIDEEFINKEQP